MNFAPLLDFVRDDCGAVTVDWVVLSAAVVGLGMTSVGAIRQGISALGGDISLSLTNVQVASLGMLGDDAYAGRWVEASGRGVAWVEDFDCSSEGICPPSITHINMSYVMDDGSYWSMQSTQSGDDDPVVAWFDENGDPAEAPRFRD